MTTKGYILDHEGTNVDNVRYDDLQGEVATAPIGAAQWSTAQIGSTGFFINWLNGGADDFFQILFQMPHRKALSTNLESIHVHHILSIAPVAGTTIKLDYAYAWINLNSAIPVIGSWVSDTKIITFTGAEAANTYYLHPIVNDVAPPANEGYSSQLFFKCTRNSLGVGADTYAGNLGLLYLDAHYATNRLGSVNEYTD